MPNKIIEKDNTVSIRLDGAYVSNGKYISTPFVRDDGKESYFGSFKFKNADEAKATLVEAVKLMRKKNPQLQDTVFYGNYPKWEETEQYGKQLKFNGKVNFFVSVKNKDKVAEDQIEDFAYALEVHLSATKDNSIFLRVARAIATEQLEGKFNDELFEEDDFFDVKGNVDISNDDLPF